ncbi:MAG TPA: TIR domain-containing protein [Ktedonobacteraceae bacterium]|nr:TIR domain-containing protein [Ktedonobacteraceae bacterium]
MQRIKLYFSFASDSDKDKRYVQALEKQLADQTLYGEVQIWHIHKASPGSNIQQATITKLNSADIILIFLSPDYMNNAYLVNREGAQAASMQSWGIASVRVLRIRPISYRSAPFNFCQVLPESGEFISTLRHKEEEILHDVASDIYTLIKEVRSNRTEREAKRLEYKAALQQAHYMPVMTSVESLIKTRQTDDAKLHRLEKKTDEVKSARQTDDLDPRRTRNAQKTDIKTKRGDRVLADNSQYASNQEIQSIARAQRRRQAGIREVRNTHKPRTRNKTSWLDGADKEYKFFNKGYWRKLFFYSVILADSFGLAAALLSWWNSWAFAGLTLIISLPMVVIGAINTGNFLPIPLALAYAGVWGIIAHHFFLSLKPAHIIGIMAVITFIHLFLFHKNSR